MKEHPILFSGPMVRAILEGRKTQTRRVIKPRPHGILCLDCASPSGYTFDSPAHGEQLLKCPYGNVGDRLWVRETFTRGRANFEPKTGATWKGKNGATGPYLYRANEYTNDSEITWRPCIFMPRVASRITLEITAVRVERLQDISESDAIAEGIRREKNLNGDYGWLPAHEGNWELSNFPRNAFCTSWQFVNFKSGFGWDKNPWVWVVEFKRVEGESGR